MVPITCKPNVRLKALTPALTWIFYALDGFVRHSGAKYLPAELVITAIYDGEHLPESKHYIGQAIDIRSKNILQMSDKLLFRRELEGVLNTHPLALAQGVGNAFRVLLENPGGDNEHFHVQVKKGGTFEGV